MKIKKHFLILLSVTFFSFNTNPINKKLKKSSCITVNFDTINYNSQAICSDILTTYAKKPKELEFVKCERVEKKQNGQAILRATYRVEGKKSKKVEDFLVRNYGMGKLKFACCGWDNGIKSGNFNHPELKKINKHCTAIITMHGDATVKNKIEKDRNKIKYFTVIVELAII